MVQVMLVDADDAQLSAVSQYFCSSSSISIVGTVKDYKTFCDCNIKDVDFIFINMMLNGLDSLRILSKLKDERYKAKIVIYSDYLTKEMYNHIKDYNPDYIVKGLLSGEEIEELIKRLSVKSVPSNDDLDIQITNLLHTLGVPSHVKGFNFIRDGIKLIYEDRSYIGSITKRLYPDIALKNNSTYTKVERTIRHAIEVAWNRGDYDKMEELFGNSVDFDRAKPTNSEFLVTLADRLVLENR